MNNHNDNVKSKESITRERERVAYCINNSRKIEREWRKREEEKEAVVEKQIMK